MSENFDSALTYTSYLAVDELLNLQRPLSQGPEHDEMLFIIITKLTNSGSNNYSMNFQKRSGQWNLEIHITH